MNEHFRAFSFVDQITLVHEGSRVQGRYFIPSGLKDFPSALAAEAVGQLAAWAAMEATDFERRPDESGRWNDAFDHCEHLQRRHDCFCREVDG